jgi:hypothetical protein
MRATPSPSQASAAIMAFFTRFYAESQGLVELFKNALCYTLAYNSVSAIDATEQDVVLVIICVSVFIFFTVAIKTQLESIFVQRSLLLEFLTGPLECVLFLCTIVTNILTQFLSTLLARWVVTFPPGSSTNIGDVLPVAAISLILFWALMYSIGAVELVSDTSMVIRSGSPASQSGF